jgi:hypothetical protein
MFQTKGRMMEQAEEDDNSKESEASEKSIDRAGDVLLVLGTDTLRVCAEFSVTYFVPFFFFFFFFQFKLMAPMQVHPCSISWIICYGPYEETHSINWKPELLIWRRY